MASNSVAERVRDRFLGEPGLSERVASRFIMQRLASSRWDGKIVGKSCRLQWSRAQWLLEELPQKGKRKLRVAEMQNVGYIAQADHLLPENILQDANVGRGDDYDGIKKKIEKAMVDAGKAAVKDKKAPDWVAGPSGNMKWFENQVYFLEVVPEDVNPFKAEGKDFTVDVAWTDFKSYSPSSDFQQHDPHYTKIKQKSPGAARKLYNTLKTEPDALKSVTWDDFGRWLDTKKIGYDMEFSQWT